MQQKAFGYDKYEVKLRIQRNRRTFLSREPYPPSESSMLMKPSKPPITESSKDSAYNTASRANLGSWKFPRKKNSHYVRKKQFPTSILMENHTRFWIAE
jgi:hypothetical protein